MHALIRNDAIVLTGPLPYPTWPDPDAGRWWDDAYNIGDRVAFEGSNYESTIDGNTWSPTEYPAGWTLLP